MSNYALPPVVAGKNLEYAHFPNKIACFVYRNWEVIAPSVMAEVLETDENTVLTLAEKMGLCKNPRVSPDWNTLGYITIIRSNWHLLSYRQICKMLGWNEEKLAYTIKEDDFLSVKLGNFKPDTGELLYHAFTPQEEQALQKIKEYTVEAQKYLSPVTVEPFDFKTMFERARYGVAQGGEARFADRITYSYCALYGDTFIDNTEKSFPDELLRAYQAAGINGIWCQAVLYTLYPFPFQPELSACYEQRMKGLNALTARMKNYGIKLYLYLNEPRTMPNAFFDRYPHLKGVTGGDFSSLCTSTPEVQKYLYDGAAYIAKNAPDIGGFFTITASENQTSCYSHRADGGCECPRCKNRTRAEVIAEVNTLLYRGAASVKPDIKLIAWTWGWDRHIINDIIDRMPPEIIVMGVSEQAVQKDIGGIVTEVLDYSISVVGPGEYAKSTWKHAHEKNHLAYAKMQLNNTWECSFTPFIPAWEQVYRHLTGVIESGADGLMLNWTLGGYPSPTFAMLSRLFYKSEKIPTLRELYEAVFPQNSVDTIEQAVHIFSQAFDKFPFHIGTAYVAPQNIGCANLLYKTPTGFHATMVGYPYDDLNGWRSIFPAEVFARQMEQLSIQWKQGLDVLHTIAPDTPILQDLFDAAEACYCHFRSMYLQIRYVQIHDPSCAKEEAELALRLANIISHNPLIGYESSNHYFYTRSMLLEKYVNCMNAGETEDARGAKAAL